MCPWSDCLHQRKERHFPDLPDPEQRVDVNAFPKRGDWAMKEQFDFLSKIP
jgi:hypothetical protein